MINICKVKLTCIVLLCCTSLSWAEVDWDLLVACVIEVESGGNPNAVSNAGAIGLMQITPIVLQEWNQYQKSLQINLYYDERSRLMMYKNLYKKKNLFDSSINYEIGTWYLYRLQYHYKCPTIECILAGYNGGITRLKKNNWDISKMPKETKEYVKKVMKLYERGK